MILEVAVPEPGVADQPVPALLDELAGQPQVRFVARFPVQLRERGLDDGVAVDALLTAQEVIDEMVREPPGHGEQPGITGAALAGEAGLDQVARRSTARDSRPGSCTGDGH